MEMLLILAALVVAVLALAFVWVMSARDRRPPLRTRQEEELGGGDPEGVIASMRRAPTSPIDRNAPILEIAAIEKALEDSRLIEGRVRNGQVVHRQVVHGQAGDDGPEDTAKARPWKAAQTDQAAGPNIARRGPASR